MATPTLIRKEPDPIILSEVVRDRLKAAMDDGRLLRPYSYQAERLLSAANFNLDLWSRQIGKSHTNAQDSVNLANTTGYPVMLLSASQDQTKELMLKSALYAEVIQGVAGEIQRAIQNDELSELMYVDDDKVEITQTIISLPNGTRLIGRPANPRTARGYSSNVKLDEFAMHQKQREIRLAAFASITSNPKLRFDISSTPGLSSSDDFAQLIAATLRGETDFAMRKVTIYQAIAAGYPVDAERLRRNLNDEDGWKREYLCEFIDEAGAFLSYDLIRACQHEGIRTELPADPRNWDEKTLGWNPAEGDLFLGVDIGRRKDLTVFWLAQMLGDVLWTRAVMCYRNTPFSEQFEIGNQLHRFLPIRRTAVDATGMGEMLAEEWQKEHGSYRVEALHYTMPLKQSLAEKLKSKFDDRQLRIPIDRAIVEDLHSVQKLVTTAGNIRFAGERTPDGHADRFWGLANVVHAAEQPLTVPKVWAA